MFLLEVSNADFLRHKDCFGGLFSLTSALKRTQVKLPHIMKTWGSLELLMPALPMSARAVLLGECGPAFLDGS